MSTPINKKMVHALYVSGDIEAWGQGTLEIISSSLRHSGIPPIFSDRLSGIMVSIYKTDDAFYSELELDDRLISIIKYIQKSGSDYSGINVPLVAVCNVPPVARCNVPPQKWLQ